MVKNLWSKTRKIDEPYLEITNGPFAIKVLKAYQSREKEIANTYARWFVAVKSPMTYDSWEYGDTYIKDIGLDTNAVEVLSKRQKDEQSKK